MPGGSRLGGTGHAGRLLGLAVERVFRRYCARKGGWIYFTATIDRPSLARTLVRGSLRLALDLGRTILAARGDGDDPVTGALRVADGKLLFRGRIGDVERKIT